MALTLVVVAVITAALAPAPLAGQAPSDTEFGVPHPTMPAALSGLAFLIGEWDLDTWFQSPDGTRTPGRAHLTGRFDLGGMAISTLERYPSSGDQPDFMSTKTFAYNPRLERVLGSGINTLGNRKDFQVAFDGDRVIVRQSGMLFEGRRGVNRTTFSEIAPRRFRVTSEHSPDDGVTWRTEFGYTATRVR